MKLYQILSLTIISVLGFSVVGANSVQYTNPLNMLITHSQAEHLVGNINFTFFSELQGLNIGGINYSIVLNHWGINSYGNASLDMIFRNITTGTQNVAAEEYVILTNQSNQLYKNVLAIESGMNSSQTCNGITGNGYTITFSGIGCPNTDTLSTTIVNSTNFGMTYSFFSGINKYNSTDYYFVAKEGNYVVIFFDISTGPAGEFMYPINSTNLEDTVYADLNSNLAQTTSTVSTTVLTTLPTTTTPTTTSSTAMTYEPVVINITPGWNMLSVPDGISTSDIGTIYTQLQTNCGMSNSQKLWSYNNSGNSYIWINGPGSGIGTFETYVEYIAGTPQGTITSVGGFWFHSQKQCSIETHAVTVGEVYANLNGKSLITALSTGWNMISVPLITTDKFSTIASSCNLRGGLYNYNPITNTYTNTTIPVAGKGYFVYTNAPCMLNWTPNTESSSPPSAP